MSATTKNQTEAGTIRPFTIPVAPETELDALRARITATRWPDRELVADHSQGVQLKVIQELARYWAEEYDLRRYEARLSARPNFITEIDGLDIHFIHVRSPHENALPIIITHGWPGSVVELLKIIGPLTNPTAHGASAADAFDVVIPSIPGYGYSGKPRETGWDPARIAGAWTELMKRLGYTRFVAQGGDWGAIITDVLAVQAPPGLLGMHTNMAGVVPADVSTALARNILGAGGPPPSGLSADESRTYEQLNFFYTKGIGYGIEMITQPQTLYGIADSPVGLAAWMLNHDASSYSDIADAVRGAPRRRPDPGRSPRQPHVLLADEHSDFLDPTVLGEHVRLLRRQGRQHPGRRDRLPQGDLQGAAQLGRAGLPQSHLLQRGRPGLPLRRLAGARAVHRRAARRVPVTALADHARTSMLDFCRVVWLGECGPR